MKPTTRAGFKPNKADRTGPINYDTKHCHSISYKGSALSTHLYAHLYSELQILIKNTQFSVKLWVPSRLEPRSCSKGDGFQIG